MKNKIFFSLFLIFITALNPNQINSQNGWIQQYSGTGENLSGISFINPNTGFVCGEWGTVLKTTNGGSTWFQVSIPDNNYYDICMVTENIVIAGGVLPPIYRSSDCGLTWAAVDSAYFREITFCNQQTGWIAATKLLKTTNAGLNWNRYNFYYNRFPGGIHFLDSLNGYIFGHTTGYPPPNYLLNYLQKTTNGGINWTEIVSINTTGVLFGDIFFLNAMTGYVGGFGEVRKTTNGGINWQVYGLPSLILTSEILFVNSQTGWLVPYLSYTTNGGVNWALSGINGFFSGIFFINESTGWICGDYGKIYKTTNCGSLSIKRQENKIPTACALEQNYPNPFNPNTVIIFKIKDTRFVKLKVFDALGREVRTLVEEKLSAGGYEVTFEGSDLATGIYFYRLEAEDFSEVKKMVLIK